MIWTAPTGQVYTTKPAGALLFPILAKPTGQLVPPADIPAGSDRRGMMMPARTRSRAQDRRARTDYGRGLNAALLAAQPPPEPEPPPPF